MADKRISMPASTAGLTRYFDDYRSKIEFNPGHVIIFAAIIIIITLLLHAYGSFILGI